MHEAVVKGSEKLTDRLIWQLIPKYLHHISIQNHSETKDGLAVLNFFISVPRRDN